MKLLKQQEFVVGGWTEPRQTRQHFGSLLRRLLRRRRRAALGGIGRHGLRSEGARSRRASCCARARRATQPVRRRVQDDGEGALGAARSRRRNPVHGVDERRPAAASRLSRHARPTRRRATSGARTPRPREAGACRDAAGERYGRIDGRQAELGVVRSREDRDEVRRREGPADATPASTSLIDRLNELEDAQKDGDLALPERRHAARDESRQGLLAGARHHQGRSAPLLRRRSSPLLLPAVDDRPLVMKRFPERRRQARRSISSAIRKRRRRACGAKSCPTTSSRSTKRARAIG